MDKVKRPRHTRHFKQQAVALAKGSDRSVRSVALSLGVRPQTLEYWMEHPPRDPGAGGVEAEAGDPVALRLQLNEARQRIRVLEMEKEILKKATAFFAREQP
jgi:transposase-like protein